MRKITQEDIDNVVVQQDNNIITSSRSVADIFGKSHKNVLRTIDSIKKMGGSKLSHPPYNEMKFIEGSYTNEQNGQKYRKVLMNRNAFMNVISGFTGQKAFEFRNMYFHSFNMMEAKLMKQPKINKLAQRDKGLIQNERDEYKTKYHQLKHLNWYVDNSLKLLQPKANAYDQEMTSKYVYPLSHLAERYGTDAMHMNLVLQKMGVIGKHSNRWYLTKNFRGEMYASHDISYVGEHGSSTDSGALKWTQKGFDLIRTLLKLHYSVTELHQRGNDFNMKFLMYQEHHRYKITELGYEQLKQLNLIQERDDK